MLTFPTGLGTCGIRWSPAGVTGILLPRTNGLPGAALADAWDVPAPIRAAVGGITALLAGEPRDLREVVLDWDGIDAFRRRVLAAAREVGPGEVVTYGELGRRIGEPGGARAVGAALGSNPWPIVVPCHRVLGAGGALTGFSAPGGVATKRRMLEIERAPGFEQQPLFA